MKLYKLLLVGFTILGVVYSCQKELEFDPNGPSQGTLAKDGSGNCLPSNINGLYQKDTVLSSSNYIDVQVNVAIIGTYTIKTDSINGYSFTASGKFVSKGTNTVRLFGSGKPLATGVNNFTVSYNNSTCNISVTVTGAGVGLAVYTLANLAGICSGAVVNGVYQVGVAPTAANTVDLQVNVTTPGTYVIAATGPSGLIFTSTGIFTSGGLNTITLSLTNTPTSAGSAIITATNLATSCTFVVNVLPAGGGGAAAFTFGGAGGACTPATVNGTYTAGTALTAANTVTIRVNVTTVGTYTISTNTVNGYSFTKSGTFTSAIPQDVILNSVAGPPTAAGTNPFTVTSPQAPSNCTFSVTVNPAANTDLFPLTANSWWSYDSDKYAAPDTLLKKATILRTLAGNSYREVEASQNTQPYFDTVHYRKSGNDYFEYVTVDSFFSNYFFTDYQFHELNFLKENATAGTTWSSAEFSGIELGSSPPTPLKLKYSYTVASTTGTLVVNGITYTNVTKIDVKAQANPNNTGYVDDAIMEFYYSKGVGLIRFNFKDAASPGWDYNDDIRNYQVF